MCNKTCKRKGKENDSKNNTNSTHILFSRIDLVINKNVSAVVPSVNGKWEVKEVFIPQPGVNQVLIKIHASGICYTDIHTYY